MDLDIYPEQSAVVTILGPHEDDTGYPVRLVSVSVREIVLACAHGCLGQGWMVKLACAPYVILARVAGVEVTEGEDRATLEIRHLLTESDLRLIRDKWF